MSRWALVSGGVVVNVVEQASQPTLPGDWRDVTGQPVGPGHLEDGNGGFVPAAAVSPRHITPLAFRQRFDVAERVTLEIAALDDPSASMPARQAAAALRSMLADVQTARYIDLDRADTRAGVQQLETLGLLAAGRALDILDVPVQAHEQP